MDEANRFLREQYIGEFNGRFQVAPAQRGSAFVTCPRSKDLNLIFALQFERTVNRDNTVSFQNLQLQIEPVQWRGPLAGCNVMVHQHLDGTISLTHRPHRLGRYSAQGVALDANKNAAGEHAVEKTRRGMSSRQCCESCEVRVLVPPIACSRADSISDACGGNDARSART